MDMEINCHRIERTIADHYSPYMYARSNHRRIVNSNLVYRGLRAFAMKTNPLPIITLHYIIFRALVSYKVKLFSRLIAANVLTVLQFFETLLKY